MGEPGSPTEREIRRESSLPAAEILVAIGVLVVVGALTAFLVRSSHGDAGGGNCASRQRMIATALSAYEEENDSKIVPRYIGRGVTFDRLLDPFIESSDAWRCPSDGARAANLRSIGMNRSVGVVYAGAGPWDPPVDAAALDNPGQLIVFSDDAPVFRESSTDLPPTSDEDQSAVYACRVVANARAAKTATEPHMLGLLRHKGRANIAYADGHVGYALPAQTLTPRVQWFLGAPLLGKYLPGMVQHERDCELLKAPAAPPGSLGKR